MKISLKYNQKYVSAELDGTVNANRDALGSWETWTVETLSNGKVSLKSAHNLYLCAEEGGGKEVHANREGVGPWEQFSDLTNFGCSDGQHFLGISSSLRVDATRTSPLTFTVEIVEGGPSVGGEEGFIHAYNHSGNLVYGFATEDGKPWQMLGYSAHLLPVRVLKGEDIVPFIKRAQSYGANTLITIGTHLSPWKDANGYHFDPRNQAEKDALSKMFSICSEQKMRVAHAVAADFQYGLSDDDKRRIWREQCELMDGKWNLFARLGNESNVNGWDPSLFDRPNLHGVLQSAGSSGIGNPPHQDYRDFSEWEGRRTPDSPWHKCLDDAGAGMFEQLVGYGDQHGIPVPTVMLEGQFFADTDPDHVGDRRSVSPEKALQYGLQIGASCAGGAVGTSLGLEGKLDGDVAAECARQQLSGMKAAFLRT